MAAVREAQPVPIKAVAESLPSPLPRQVFWAVVAALPFLSIYLVHYTSPRGLPTGFVLYDMPYYCANGREVFERGNGLSHPNPYDPDPEAPAIYFHWLTWLLGFGIKELGLPPGELFVGVGIAGALATSWLTYRLVEAVVPAGRGRTLLFLFAMWGGGVLCLARATENLLDRRPLLDNLFAYDPIGGWWFLNWGRNLVYATESVYHAIVAATWLAVVRRRWALAVGGSALLAATHPFSGLQLVLMLFTWFALLAVWWRSGRLLLAWMAMATVLAAFLGYYLVFLESFPQHRALRETWSLDWVLELRTFALAYGPVGLLVVLRLWLDRRHLDETVGFFAVCFEVSLLLAKHEWFLAPRQPLHFTRGYIWMPLCLLALPLLQRLLSAIWRRPTRGALALAAVAGLIAISDNACFLTSQWETRQRIGLYLTPGEREMLTWMDREGVAGVLLCPDLRLSYVSATFTPARPYLGHWANTPHYKERRQQVLAWFEDGQPGAWLEEVDCLLLARDHPPQAGLGEGWELWHENEDLLLFRRTARQPRPAKKRAFSPVPQPASRTLPAFRSATSSNGCCGLPISQGDWPALALSTVWAARFSSPRPPCGGGRGLGQANATRVPRILPNFAQSSENAHLSTRLREPRGPRSGVARGLVRARLLASTPRE